MSLFKSLLSKLKSVSSNKPAILLMVAIPLLLLLFFVVVYSYSEIPTYLSNRAQNNSKNIEDQEVNNQDPLESELQSPDDTEDFVPQDSDPQIVVPENTPDTEQDPKIVIKEEEKKVPTPVPDEPIVPTEPTVPPEPNIYNIVLKETTYNEMIEVLFTVSYDYYDQTTVTYVEQAVSPYINIKYGTTNLKLLWNAGVLPMTMPSKHFTEILKIQSYQQYLDPTIGYLFRNEADLFRVKVSTSENWYYSNNVSLTESCTDAFSEPVEAPCGKPYGYVFGIHNFFLVSCSGADVTFCDSISKIVEIKKSY